MLSDIIFLFFRCMIPYILLLCIGFSIVIKMFIKQHYCNILGNQIFYLTFNINLRFINYESISICLAFCQSYIYLNFMLKKHYFLCYFIFNILNQFSTPFMIFTINLEIHWTSHTLIFDPYMLFCFL